MQSLLLRLSFGPRSGRPWKLKQTKTRRKGAYPGMERWTVFGVSLGMKINHERDMSHEIHQNNNGSG
jgi:hypothetical protein